MIIRARIPAHTAKVVASERARSVSAIWLHFEDTSLTELLQQLEARYITVMLIRTSNASKEQDLAYVLGLFYTEVFLTALIMMIPNASDARASIAGGTL